MRRTTTLLLAVVAVMVVAVEARAQARRPNIVVIVADDMGYADIGVHGSKDIPTPNIDALAAGGVRFTDGYVSGPYCSPTRAGLLTGKYPQRFGHEFNIGMIDAHRDVGLPLEEKTVADRLKGAGYRTALIGKWHLGSASRFFPTRRGFDEFFGFLPGAHSYLAPQTNLNPIYDGEERVPRIPYLTDTLAARAADFITRNRAQPFFLYVAFSAVHTPLQATDRYLARFPDIANQTRRTYAAMLSAMDDGIGRVIDALRAANLEDNTLIVFFNDNGGPLGERQVGWNGSSNAPLHGEKAQTWEGGIRVPFIMRWKGRLPGGKTYSEPVIQLDVFPTVLAAAGVTVQPEWKLDGVNLIPFLTGAASGSPHETLFWRLGAVMAVRRGPWKLLKWFRGGADDDPSTLTLAGAQLFNLREDIGETTDLAKRHPDRVKELSDAWLEWANQLMPPRWPPPQAARGAVRECAAGRRPQSIANYAGTWRGSTPGFMSWMWTQRSDSTGDFVFGSDTVPIPTRITLASPDSVVFELTRPVSTPQRAVEDTRIHVVGYVCDEEMAGFLFATRTNEPSQRIGFDARRSP
jgi:arylsulfatase A-like enzyme